MNTLAIDVGDKWTFEMTPAKADKRIMTSSYEVVGTEKLKGIDALKISAKLEEKGENGMSSKGFFWISKEGKPLKYELDVKNWVVPMAGSEPVDGAAAALTAQAPHLELHVIGDACQPRTIEEATSQGGLIGRQV